MHTQRAVRRYLPDPVPDELITKVLDAAIRAPSAI
ncbi:MAG: nitroreductase family protein, partial [bacterium]|nr:nitroreductase family protein [bacterium]